MKNTQKPFLIVFEDLANLKNTFGDVASSNCRENLDFLQKNLKSAYCLDVELETDKQ